MKYTVLVPGFWHGTWSWNLVVPELARLRIPAVAVDLEGQGLGAVSPAARWARPFEASAFAAERSGVADVTATSAAEALVGQLRMLGADGPSVVVAHSMGGVVATLAAEMAPSLVSHLVYVAAFAPVAGLPAGADVASELNAGELGTSLLRADPFAIGASRIDPGDPGSHESLRAALYADVPDATARAAISLLGTDAPVGIAAEPISVTRERFGSVPHTYLVCTDDRLVRPALQRKIVSDIDRVSVSATRTVELACSHSPFLSRPRQVAEAVAETWR
ncbi:alpha/beta fold hydrolase [Pseudonocardia sp. ICBG1293]|uniref:alpha/beta fold hydrolase n=1 Tax=Pseudonocardia sp. ICBG1293 TaxID=2844382 RepID=UPI001CCC5AE2|nr:alpha/beta hydrolase [Pseudonocardia sp. ICBG1293]